MEHLHGSTHTEPVSLNLACLTMIRNEVDIIGPFLQSADTLFDRLVIVDMQSTDGTRKVIDTVELAQCRIEIYNFTIMAKYQSQIMRTLAQQVAKEEADWIFLLDVDEFLDVENRDQLEEYLKSACRDVLYMPWINLVPERYGSYSDFDVNQDFFWSGRASKYSKVALTGSYVLRNPGFLIGNGNHSVSATAVAQPEPSTHSLGLPLLHVPVRSPERARYKAENAKAIQANKHNQETGEGLHHAEILELVSRRGLSDHVLNAVAADYGFDTYFDEGIDPRELGWPRKRLPFLHDRNKFPSLDTPSLVQVLGRERELLWQNVRFVKHSPVKGVIDGLDIRLVPQAISGSGECLDQVFESLPARANELPTDFGPGDLLECITASLVPPQFLPLSAWSQLSPLLFCLFSLLRPRRYVELGVHHGMSFFVACQASETLAVQTECIAVDSWLGDSHASFHSPSVLADFKDYLRSHYPDQYYLHAFFDDASMCFEPKSVDLLHVDGYHSYDAVKHDYLTWLPKMSAEGVMMFHDINVHERGFGVWRLWEEIRKMYPTVSFMHCHGLGIAYVGERSSGRIAELFEAVTHSEVWPGIAQHYFETIGPMMIEHVRMRNELVAVKQGIKAGKESGRNGNPMNSLAVSSGSSRTTREQRLQAELERVLKSKWWRATKPFRWWSNRLRKLRGRPKKRWLRTAADV